MLIVWELCKLWKIVKVLVDQLWNPVLLPLKSFNLISLYLISYNLERHWVCQKMLDLDIIQGQLFQGYPNDPLGDFYLIYFPMQVTYSRVNIYYKGTIFTDLLPILFLSLNSCRGRFYFLSIRQFTNTPLNTRWPTNQMNLTISFCSIFTKRFAMSYNFIKTIKLRSIGHYILQDKYP